MWTSHVVLRCTQNSVLAVTSHHSYWLTVKYPDQVKSFSPDTRKLHREICVKQITQHPALEHNFIQSEPLVCPDRVLDHFWSIQAPDRFHLWFPNFSHMRPLIFSYTWYIFFFYISVYFYCYLKNHARSRQSRLEQTTFFNSITCEKYLQPDSKNISVGHPFFFFFPLPFWIYDAILKNNKEFATRGEGRRPREGSKETS